MAARAEEAGKRDLIISALGLLAVAVGWALLGCTFLQWRNNLVRANAEREHAAEARLAAEREAMQAEHDRQAAEAARAQRVVRHLDRFRGAIEGVA